MPTQVTNYQCPACTGPLHYSAKSGKLACDYCDSSFDVAEIEALYARKEAEAALYKAQAQTLLLNGGSAEELDQGVFLLNLGDTARHEVDTIRAGAQVINIPDTKPEYLAFALNKDNKELLQQVNEAMEKLKKSGEFQQIYKKWFNTDMPDLPTSADAVLK